MRCRRVPRIVAIAAILLWIGGIEVAPNLHVALHDALAPHVHDAATGAVVRVSFTTVTERPHVHPDGTLHDPAARTTPTKTPRGSALRLTAAADAPHLHAIVAWTAPPAPIAHALDIDRVATSLVARAIITPASFSPGRAVARGPPLVVTFA